MHFRPCEDTDIEALIQLSLLAFEPIFASFAEILGPYIFKIVYPNWQESQSEGVRKVCENEKIDVWVAEKDGKVVGFIAYEIYEHDQSAEVQLLAVQPEYQNEGIGTALNELALQKMRQAGKQIAVVGTGGDESHAPARRSYEKAGYTALPLVRYYKKL